MVAFPQKSPTIFSFSADMDENHSLSRGEQGQKCGTKVQRRQAKAELSTEPLRLCGMFQMKFLAEFGVCLFHILHQGDIDTNPTCSPAHFFTKIFCVASPSFVVSSRRSSAMSSSLSPLGSVITHAMYNSFNNGGLGSLGGLHLASWYFV